jgi:hypothetical protein
MGEKMKTRELLSLDQRVENREQNLANPNGSLPGFRVDHPAKVKIVDNRQIVQGGKK